MNFHYKSKEALKGKTKLFLITRIGSGNSTETQPGRIEEFVDRIPWHKEQEPHLEKRREAARKGKNARDWDDARTAKSHHLGRGLGLQKQVLQRPRGRPKKERPVPTQSKQV